MDKIKELKKINIGRLIQAKVDERHISYAEFARMINCARTSLYHIFNSKSIDIDRLLVISEVLHYDFIEAVYLKRDELATGGIGGGGGVVLPFREGHIDVSQLPRSLKELIMEGLVSDLKKGDPTLGRSDLGQM